MEGLDLASEASTSSIYNLNSKAWEWDRGYRKNNHTKIKIALIDYGIKTNIIRMLNTYDCETKIFPTKTEIDSIMKYDPDGVIQSNGPGEPEATSTNSLELIRGIKLLLNKYNTQLNFTNEEIVHGEKILDKMGVKNISTKNSIKIFGNPNLKINKKIIIRNYRKDHRVFMTSVIAALSFGGIWEIHDKDSIKTSFPNFLKLINDLKK